tara:strand:- start:106 stop:1908 length:1803 start_codon:yes stop_codon:yes gene_type:complete
LSRSFDLAVVGGGHAGCEAALVAARSGLNTALVTLRVDGIGELSCNPAMGGLAKGHLVREIDALGGQIGLASDRATLFRHTLNLSRGAAVRGTRAQVDRFFYRDEMGELLQKTPHLRLIAGRVDRLLQASGRCVGLELGDGSQIHARAVVLTTGTFLGAVCHRGDWQQAGGRIDETEVDQGTITAQLQALGLRTLRLKTGTCPRLDRDSIDFDQLKIQRSDPAMSGFSDHPEAKSQRPMQPCWAAASNPRVHDVVRQNLHRSPIRRDGFDALGPRYCPSFEDKVERFSHRDSHQLFLEPEGIESRQLYVGGMSTSMPAEVQQAMLQAIPGLEAVRVLQWGYCVAYDAVDPVQLEPSLEVTALPGLYLAGQLNGTSGYEEAAAQGFWAGINALRSLRDEPPFLLRRDQAYMAVLMDDLTTRGVTEPYRMLTSRAEYRLELRESSAFLRLHEEAKAIGVVSQERLEQREGRREAIDQARSQLESSRSGGRSGWQHLSRPHSDLEAIAQAHEVTLPADGMDREEIQAQARYAGYIERERRRLRRYADLDRIMIPVGFDFSARPGLSTEAAELLQRVQPRSLGQASRIPGMTPAATHLLAMSLK